jgi:hypothetical protein
MPEAGRLKTACRGWRKPALDHVVGAYIEGLLIGEATRAAEPWRISGHGLDTRGLDQREGGNAPGG